MNSQIKQLDTYTLVILPNPLRLAKILLRPNKSFVVVNLLVFQERATGRYAHLSGRKAYELYISRVGKADGGRITAMSEGVG